MGSFAKEVISVNIEEELKHSYLDYAMSVIVGRALPDVRDGFKPVHRRVLYAMYELGNEWNKPYKKSARVVGDVIGKYHPHGEMAVYDTIVRMAQPFSMRTVLIDGQGNFGSIDGDAPAAMRYTEVRMAKISQMLLADLDKETVDFTPNYDGNEFIPNVLPARIPNLLLNGASGIAVGMATNIPPHNLNELIDACIALIENPNLGLDQLMQYIQGPDFPTAAIINGRSGIVDAYKTGRGRIVVRARTEIETDEKNGKQSIIVNELPFQVNKAKLIEKIAELAKLKRVEGITDLRDESDKDGMRIVIELRRGENAEVILNNLYTHTQLQSVFGVNMVALVDGQPKLLTLKELLDAFIRHRREIVTRRSIFELRKARERAHILEGLSIALTNIDEIIALIKSSQNPQDAKQKLLERTWKAGQVMQLLELTDSNVGRPDDLPIIFGLQHDGYRLSPNQVDAILELRLHRLTALEQDKIFNEYKDLIALINNLLEILSNPDRLLEVIKDELRAVKEEFGNPRRTEIVSDQQDLTIEDLISEADVVVTLSHEGYIKYQPLELYQAQRRGGKGKAAATFKEEDFVEKLIIANTHDTLLCFSNLGKVYWLKTYQIPQATRTARGKPIINLLSLAADERINALLPIKNFDSQTFIFMATQQGTVKKVPIEEFSRPRASGIIAIDLEEGDRLVEVAETSGESDVMLFSDAGKVIRFPEKLVRAMGRTAKGVRGISLQDEQKLISLVIVKQDGAILTATENGYGKRTEISDYRLTGRGGQGVISIQVNERNGKVVAACPVFPGEEVMLISDQGTLVRTRVDEISVVGRNTQGVRLINLSSEEKLVGIQCIDEELLQSSAEAELEMDSETEMKLDENGQ